MKTKLGNNFDYSQCIDESKFLDPQKIAIYAEKNGVNVTLDHSHYWWSKKPK